MTVYRSKDFFALLKPDLDNVGVDVEGGLKLTYFSAGLAGLALRIERVDVEELQELLALVR